MTSEVSESEKHARSAAAVASATIAGAALGAAAAGVQRWFSPVGVFPLLLGGCLGWACAAAFGRFELRNRRFALAATLIAATIATAAQHYATYYLTRSRDAEAEAQRRTIATAMKQQGFGEMPAEPLGFVEFLRHSADRGRPLGSQLVRGAWLIGWWALDAVLIGVAAAIVVARSGARRRSVEPSAQTSGAAS